MEIDLEYHKKRKPKNFNFKNNRVHIYNNQLISNKSVNRNKNVIIIIKKIKMNLLINAHMLI
jgi:hypothetical protein